MAQGGNKGKKAVSLREKKDGANNAALAALSKEAGEYNSMMNRVETMAGPELREYVSQNKHTLGSKLKATIKKLLRKGKPNKKRRTMLHLHPIVGATLKFHKDDDMPGAV
ncbi:uncharacterized protein [Zea mays]|uniref:Uncharacterized protein n=1 Tax=Zea mays TaxID=4577 RepID=A0A1D6J6Y0_MAIZE|nr:uncharacterized protein LOC103641641 [Zea mays]AQK43679.1 hypothetical protein ZEAMMB73_Zm00001d025399 [Zea mays]|eukprot:XP_008663196.1 uncharacterized protein LOC103641641 [Zea mays]